MEKLSNFSVMVHKKNFLFCVTYEGRVKTCPTGKSFGGRQGMFIFTNDALVPTYGTWGRVVWFLSTRVV